MKTILEKTRFNTSKPTEQFVKRYTFMAISNAEESQTSDLYDAVTLLCQMHTKNVIIDSFDGEIDTQHPSPEQQAFIDEKEADFTFTKEELIPFINEAVATLVKEGKVVSYAKDGDFRFEPVKI